MTTKPARLNNWIAWLDEELEPQVRDIIHQHLIYRSWNEIVDVAHEKTRTPGYFHRWVYRNYQDSMAVGVRRLTDSRRDTNSLVRLLMEIESDATQLTRHWWMSRAPSGLEPDWETQFEQLSRGHDHIVKATMKEDRQRLVDVARRVKDFVDSHVAHLSRERDDVDLPTFGEAHDAVLVIYEVFLRWYLVVTNASYGLLRPPLRWEHVLARAWIDEERSVEVADRRREKWDEELRERGLLKD